MLWGWDDEGVTGGSGWITFRHLAVGSAVGSSGLSLAPLMPSPTRRGRRSARPTPSPRLLHHLQALLALATRPVPPARSGDDPGSRAERRRRQHLALSQRLLDPLPEALRGRGHGAQRFWVALRWGGCGMVLAQVLGR
jgi:hypothetical protein